MKARISHICFFPSPCNTVLSDFYDIVYVSGRIVEHKPESLPATAKEFISSAKESGRVREYGDGFVCYYK